LRSAREDIAVFPLAIPLLSGPGLLTTVLVLTSEAGGRGLRFVIVGVALVLVFALTWIVLRSAGALLSRVGESGIHVATRVMGIVLAAIATQFVLNGFRDYWSSVGG
jgi:multiple antibiotic resistance protein